MVLVVSCRGGRAAGGQILARSAFLPEEMRVHAQRWLVGSVSRTSLSAEQLIGLKGAA
jgi:hypothetical protein